MDKIPTAKEYFEEELSGEPLTETSVIEGLLKFAKLHVKAALETAAEQVDKHILCSEKMILGSYPLTNIK